MPDKIAKFIKSLDSKTRNQLKSKLIELRINPFGAHDIKKMKGTDNLYRLRLGKIRIIYKLVQAPKTNIEIIDIDYRGNIY